MLTLQKANENLVIIGLPFAFNATCCLPIEYKEFSLEPSQNERFC
jgi:hypothetical protein